MGSCCVIWVISDFFGRGKFVFMSFFVDIERLLYIRF